MLHSFFPRWLAALALFVLLGASASAQEPKTNPAKMVLRVGQSVPCPADAGVEVVLTTVVADSRCPENVLCVRAGGVRLELSARRGGEAPATFILDSDRGDGTGEMCGLRFRIVAVEPGRKPGETLPQRRYTITVEVCPIHG